MSVQTHSAVQPKIVKAILPVTPSATKDAPVTRKEADRAVAFNKSEQVAKKLSTDCTIPIPVISPLRSANPMPKYIVMIKATKKTPKQK
jgi:hypothetical protein